MSKHKQKFKTGDRVHISKDLGMSMDHFYKDRDATVVASYSDQYPWGGHQGRKMYTLNIDGIGRVSWYYEHQLTRI